VWCPIKLHFSLTPHPTQYIEWSKKTGALCFVRLITPSNIDQFSNLFHSRNQENHFNNTVTKDPTTPQVCRYTTLWNVSVLEATLKTGRLL